MRSTAILFFFNFFARLIIDFKYLIRVSGSSSIGLATKATILYYCCLLIRCLRARDAYCNATANLRLPRFSYRVPSNLVLCNWPIIWSLSLVGVMSNLTYFPPPSINPIPLSAFWSMTILMYNSMASYSEAHLDWLRSPFLEYSELSKTTTAASNGII